MKPKTIRVRFAPAPTGMMHLGNIRTALMNYLFAQQKDGTFIIRIEDTDQQRNFDPQAKAILEDLQWLNLTYQEGPGIGGPYAPYFQSQRNHLYQTTLHELQNKNIIYRCFCTEEELEKKRERQRAVKLPPRYDRTCLALSPEKITMYLERTMPFVWRVKLDHEAIITIHDLAHGDVRFELKNFSDFPITRQDGSFTFIFANFVDDVTMDITHIFRGEDHLSNTANQAALYLALHKPLPIYWHMPIIGNAEGKKLSKRDFGFSLRDLKNTGFLPEAICNYLAILGGSFKQEIMSLNELVHTVNFEHLHAAGYIRYDLEKLNWVNHQWIIHYDPTKLTQLCRPFLEEAYPHATQLDDTILSHLIQTIKTDVSTLKEFVTLLTFYFVPPAIYPSDMQASIAPTHIASIVTILKTHLATLSPSIAYVNILKQEAEKNNIPIKELFGFIRLALFGSTRGPAIHDLISMLGTTEATKRIQHVLDNT